MNRLKIVTLAFAMLLVASNASAYATYMSTSYDGTQGVSDSFTVTVHFDSEDASDIRLLSVGVIFDTTYLDFVGNTSQGYMLYSPQAGNSCPPAGPDCQPATWIEPTGTNGQIWGGTNPAAPLAKVNLDWWSNRFAAPDGGGTYQTTAGDSYYTDELGTLTFHINSEGFSEIALQTSGDGNILQLGSGGAATNTIGNGPIPIGVVPEPSTVLLIGLGLTGLGFVGRPNRRRA